MVRMPAYQLMGLYLCSRECKKEVPSNALNNDLSQIILDLRTGKSKETTIETAATPVERGFGPLKTVLSSVRTDHSVRFCFTVL